MTRRSRRLPTYLTLPRKDAYITDVKYSAKRIGRLIDELIGRGVEEHALRAFAAELAEGACGPA